MNKKMIHNQLFELITAYFKEIIREPGVLFWGIAFPILMSLGLGIAFTKKPNIVRNVAVITTNQSMPQISDSSAKIISFLKNHAEQKETVGINAKTYKIIIPDPKLGNTTFLFQMTNWQNAMDLLKRGNLSIILVEKNGRIQYHFDPKNPDAQLTYLKLSELFGKQGKKSDLQKETVEPAISTSWYRGLLPWEL
jgi:ABC-2 type transport system permease protein